MSAAVNKVMLMGRVVSGPEDVRTLPNSGSTVTKFRLAVGRGKKNAQGVWENQDTMFIDCEVYAYPDAKRNLVDIVTRYVKQGDSVFVEGVLKLEEWEDKNGGGKRSKHKVNVNDIQMLGGNKGGDSEGGEQEQSAPPPRQQRTPTPAPRGGGYSPPDDESIPFSWLLPLAISLSSLAAMLA